jgi:predicted protein tyrosine phosphatase
MIINVFSLNKVKEKLNENQEIKNLISIRDLNYEYLYTIIDELVENKLILFFDDLTHYQVKHDLIHPVYKDVIKQRDIIYFNESYVEQIIKFTNHVYKENEELNIHCYAGRSRSQAIGYILNIYYNLYLENNQEHFIRNINTNNFKFMPNTDILKIMNDYLFVKNKGDLK